MTPDRRRQVEEIVQAVLRQTPEARAGFVSVACADDASLKRDVESLLSQGKKPGIVAKSDKTDLDLNRWNQVGRDGCLDPIIARRLGA